MAKTSDTEERSRRLREACKAKGWLQKDLIAATGLDRSTVSKHWNGGAISQEKAEIYATALENIDADDLSEVISPSLLKSLRQIESDVGFLILLAAGASDASALPVEDQKAYLHRRGGELLAGPLRQLRRHLEDPDHPEASTP